MEDLLYLGITLIFLLATCGLVVVCQKLMESR